MWVVGEGRRNSRKRKIVGGNEQNNQLCLHICTLTRSFYLFFSPQAYSAPALSGKGTRVTQAERGEMLRVPKDELACLSPHRRKVERWYKAKRKGGFFSTMHFGWFFSLLAIFFSFFFLLLFLFLLPSFLHESIHPFPLPYSCNHQNNPPTFK